MKTVGQEICYIRPYIDFWVLYQQISQIDVLEKNFFQAWGVLPDIHSQR